ncbi:AManganese transport system ATP-binding protein MntB [Cardinium endosymbiont of Sogatella furcifera]|uniref:metal ABC transporter ATP-binding protein n=1 Tax=Cardinium endosymbiont of Sogatella furcifera TaxID=650378 RepID=UPI000E103FC1|nr:metal ABC transporter ATP-binding protein [Cardinium endosymbiont of Sogatella furcifera]AXI23945.1 AManganese transport system ATP-binding protein MntB [Cardinium endosymbiont of Sogatella furcifera]
MQTEKHIVTIKDLTVGYANSKTVLEEVSFDLPSHKIIGIIGPNGAGKSTLLKAAMGLVPYQKGEIKLLGAPIHKVRRCISYVPQKESVDWDFPASVFDIALLGRYNRLGFFERPNKKDKAIAMQCLEELGIAHLAKRQIGELSGGQQQRVFLARALAQDAALYFMDEPFTGIDVTTEKMVIRLLKNMVAAGKTIVVVHHDLGSVHSYFDWLILLNHKLIASGDTKKVFTADLLEKTYGSRFPCFQAYSNKCPL